MQKILKTVPSFVQRMNLTQQQDLLSNKTVRRVSVLLPLVLFATLCLAVPMRAGEQVPFKGAFNPVILSATPVDPTHVHLDIAVDVIATHLGKAHGPAFATLDLTDLSYVGGGTWFAANGDSISFTFAGQFIPTSTSGVLENVETFEITGGTGRFEGATGAGIAGGLVDAATLVPLTAAPFDATISSPGSLKN
jgi:hypothetical protein